MIAAGTDTPVAVAARIAEKLGLAHPLKPATAILATNKLRQREALAEAGVPQPRWEVVGGNGTSEIPPPVVVKAADRSSRGGLSLVRRPAGLERALASAREVSRTGVVLVEEYVDGPEVTVTGFSAGGNFVPLAVTDRIAAEEGLGVPLGYAWPSVYAETAVEVTRRAVEALGIDEGPTTTRLRISRGGPEVIEVAARLGRRARDRAGRARLGRRSDERSRSPRLSGSRWPPARSPGAHPTESAERSPGFSSLRPGRSRRPRCRRP